MKKLKTLSLLFLLSLSANMLTAHNPPPDEERINEFISRMEILMLPELHNELLSLPVTMVAGSVFATPADVLQRQAGISLVRDGIWASSVSIRGLSGERILILADGNRLSTADVSGALSTFNMDNLSHIEVIRGSATVIYGTGAMGGVVNFISPRVRHMNWWNARDNVVTGGRIGTGFSSVNNLWANHAQFHVSDNNWFLSVNGSYRTAQNTQTPIGVLENSQFEDWSFGVQAGMRIDVDGLGHVWQELLVNYQRYEAQNVGIFGGALPTDANIRYRNVNRNMLSGEYIFRNPSFLLVDKLRLKAYTQNISRDMENRINEQSLRFNHRAVDITNGGKITAERYLRLFNRLTTGIEGWQRQTVTNRVRIQELAEHTYRLVYDQPVPDASMLNLGAFAHYSWDRIPGLDINVGLRFDRISVQNDSVFNPLAISIIENGRETFEEDIQRNLLFAPETRNEFSYSAHIDFVFRPRIRPRPQYPVRLNLDFRPQFPRHRFILSLSYAQRVASLEERFQFIDFGTMFHIGNPNLQPEQGGFSNFAYLLEGQNFTLQTNVFANYIFNMITAVNQSFELADGGMIPNALVNTNIDEAFLLGAEVEIRYRFNRDFWLSANAGYTRARDVQNNEYLPQIPPLHGMLELNYRFWAGIPLIVSTSANFATRQWQTARGEQETAGFVVLNANISSERIPINSTHLQFSAGVDNILNTTYFNHLRTTRMGFAQAEPGRNFYVRAQFSF